MKQPNEIYEYNGRTSYVNGIIMYECSDIKGKLMVFRMIFSFIIDFTKKYFKDVHGWFTTTNLYASSSAPSSFETKT